MLKLILKHICLLSIICICVASEAYSLYLNDDNCYTDPKLNLGCFRSEGAFQAFPPPDSPSHLNVTFNIYTHGNAFPRSVRATSALNQRIITRGLNLNQDGRVVFLVHGYLSSENHPMMTTLKRDLLDLNQHNLTVITVDWSVGAFYSMFEQLYEKVEIARKVSFMRSDRGVTLNYRVLPYGKASSNTRVVGALIARLARFLKTTKQTSFVHCIGFSLGAQTCGFAGKRYLQLTGGRKQIDHITGLDPAGPLFNGLDSKAHLWHTDAEFVDIIHTNTMAEGFKEPVGDVDFYAGEQGSFGQAQPSCEGSEFQIFIGQARIVLQRELQSRTNEEREHRNLHLDINQNGEIDSDEAKLDLSENKDSTEMEIPPPSERDQHQRPTIIDIFRQSVADKYNAAKDWIRSDMSMDRYRQNFAIGDATLGRPRMLAILRQRFNVSCSHNRAWQYYSNSIRGTCQYSLPVAIPDSYEQMGGNYHQGVRMGYSSIAGYRKLDGGRRMVFNVHMSNHRPLCQKDFEE